MNKSCNTTLSCLMCLRMEKNKKRNRFGSVGVFPPAEPMHLISTLVLQTGQHIKKSSLILQVKVLWTCTLSKMLSTTIKALLEPANQIKEQVALPSLEVYNHQDLHLSRWRDTQEGKKTHMMHHHKTGSWLRLPQMTNPLSKCSLSKSCR